MKQAKTTKREILSENSTHIYYKDGTVKRKEQAEQDSKEGLHTQGEWFVERSGGEPTIYYHIRTKEWHIGQLNPYSPEQENAKANAELIVKAVNERKALLDSKNELAKALDDISDRFLTWQSQYPDNWDELDQVIFDKAVKALNNAKNI